MEMILSAAKHFFLVFGQRRLATSKKLLARLILVLFMGGCNGSYPFCLGHTTMNRCSSCSGMWGFATATAMSL
jgi:hypothetical protein